MEQEVNNVVAWLQKQVKNADVNGLVVGLSGGLDSAVVTNLIQKAFPKQSLAVIMPLKNNPADLKDAEKVAESSQIPHMTIDLTETHELLYDTIQNQLKQSGTLNKQTDQLSDANLRARLRMSTLYTISANYNYLVTGTDNKSEWYTGYFTKYGDGGVDLLPLVQYTKKEVREMARYLNIPSDVIHKQPSADLWKGQTDESEMGTTYDYIDAYVDGKKIPEKDRKLIEKMHRQTAHKRQLPPQFISLI